MRQLNRNAAYALPVVLALLAIATVALGFSLKDSIRNVALSSLRSAEERLQATASQRFNDAQGQFSSIITGIITDTSLIVSGPPTLPDDLVILGELPATTTDLIASADFDPLVHGIMQHELWASDRIRN